MTDPLERLDKTREKFIDDIVYGKDEDVFERNARKKRFTEKYGNSHLAAWVPGLFAYVNIRDGLRNPDYTPWQKLGGCAVAITCELVLDAARVGGIYGLVKWVEYLGNNM